VYGWLEHGRFSAPVEYLCGVAKETRRLRDDWMANHRRYFRIGGITLRIDSDLEIGDRTFHPKFDSFRAEGPGRDTVTVRHRFTLPDLTGVNLGRELYRKPPWAIHSLNGSYCYLGISAEGDDSPLHRLATFSADHTRGTIYNDREDQWKAGHIHSLTMFPTDQILIARLLADRQGCYLHSAGAIIGGRGYLFAGHSGAGKSTLTRMLIGAAAKGTLRSEILCDDRNILRRMDGGWRVYGSWSHGEVEAVSGSEAPAGAVCFMEQALENTLTPLADPREIVHRLLACVIRPFVTADWWEKTLAMTETMAREVRFYLMRFDKSGKIIEEIRRLGAFG
jgi:hypothetical protein